MSISNEISRIAQAKANIITALQNKQSDIPTNTLIDNIPPYIDKLETGTSGISNIIGYSAINRTNVSGNDIGSSSMVSIEDKITLDSTLSEMGVINSANFIGYIKLSDDGHYAIIEYQELSTYNYGYIIKVYKITDTYEYINTFYTPAIINFPLVGNSVYKPTYDKTKTVLIDAHTFFITCFYDSNKDGTNITRITFNEDYSEMDYVHGSVNIYASGSDYNFFTTNPEHIYYFYRPSGIYQLAVQQFDVTDNEIATGASVTYEYTDAPRMAGNAVKFLKLTSDRFLVSYMPTTSSTSTTSLGSCNVAIATINPDTEGFNITLSSFYTSNKTTCPISTTNTNWTLLTERDVLITSPSNKIQTFLKINDDDSITYTGLSVLPNTGGYIKIFVSGQTIYGIYYYSNYLYSFTIKYNLIGGYVDTNSIILSTVNTYSSSVNDNIYHGLYDYDYIYLSSTYIYDENTHYYIKDNDIYFTVYDREIFVHKLNIDSDTGLINFFDVDYTVNGMSDYKKDTADSIVKCGEDLYLIFDLTESKSSTLRYYRVTLYKYYNGKLIQHSMGKILNGFSYYNSAEDGNPENFNISNISNDTVILNYTNRATYDSRYLNSDELCSVVKIIDGKLYIVNDYYVENIFTVATGTAPVKSIISEKDNSIVYMISPREAAVFNLTNDGTLSLVSEIMKYSSVANTIKRISLVKHFPNGGICFLGNDINDNGGYTLLYFLYNNGNIEFNYIATKELKLPSSWVSLLPTQSDYKFFIVDTYDSKFYAIEFDPNSSSFKYLDKMIELDMGNCEINTSNGFKVKEKHILKLDGDVYIWLGYQGIILISVSEYNNNLHITLLNTKSINNFTNYNNLYSALISTPDGIYLLNNKAINFTLQKVLINYEFNSLSDYTSYPYGIVCEDVANGDTGIVKILYLS